jgi:phenylacetate-CoA ligase
MGGACPTFKGAHVCEDLAVVECIDPETGQPAAKGQLGHLVVTTLQRDNGMLRYDLEDLITYDDSPCECGETSARITWKGRAKDLVHVRDKSFLPVDIWWVLEDFPALKSPTIEFNIVRRPHNDSLEVRVEGDPKLAADIQARLEERLGVPATVTLVDHGALGRSAFKPVRVVDES